MQLKNELKHQEIIDKYVKLGASNIDAPMVDKAISFAIKYHGQQKRASGDPYYHHPLEVAEIIALIHLDNSSIVTAILHDTIEDTDLTIDDIRKHFGDEVAKLVDGVTKLTKIEFKTHNVRQAENFRKLLLAMSDDIRVLLVKLADRLHNMRTINYIQNPEKRKRIAIDTMEIYAPLAERIGMQQIKVELQDICFCILNPEIRDSILNRFNIIFENKEHLVSDIIKELEEEMKIAKIKCNIHGRKKTPFSTWMKMQQKDIGIEQLSDIIAFRIIVNRVEDCYRVLGIVHLKYKMVPGNFQDFISIPKNNGYRSIHTVVIGPLKQKIEIQVRTQEMHDIAEFGVAAHWRYKQGFDDLTDGKQYTWIRELLGILEQSNDSEEFFYNTKMAMYYDQVFCFTPKGNLIALPKGATPVDFAYTVHSDIGNSCVGAKVNGRVVPLRTELQNGDQIEIITSKDQVASPTWESFVVTGKARGEIKKSIRGQQNEQYAKLGHNILMQLFKHMKIPNESYALKRAAEFFNKSQEELLISVGDGSISREEVLKNLAPKQNKWLEALKLFNFRKTSKQVSTANEINDSAKVPIKGLLDGMAIHYAKCCHPLPGDRIVGVMHAGNGITIHSADCNLLSNFESIPDRIIELMWDDEGGNIPFISKVRVVLTNQPSALANVASEISKQGGNIVNFRILHRASDFFDMTFDVEAKSIEHIAEIISSLRTQKVVQHAERYKSN